MMTDKWTYRWLWSCLLAGGLLLSGCSDSHEEALLSESDSEPGTPLELRALTRTEGATPLTGSISSSIRVLLTSATDKMQIGDFTNTGTGWSSELSVKEERQYYLYGYMPKAISNRSSTDTVAFTKPANPLNYADGIDITMKGLPALTNEDICVVVGVQRVDGEGASANVVEGNYSYLSGIWGKNYVNLLMGHVYCSVKLNFKLDANYAKLRSIRLKEITLSSTYGNVDATLNLRSGSKGITPTFTRQETSNMHTSKLLESPNSLPLLDSHYTVDPLEIPLSAYCTPAIFDVSGQYVSITTKYEVLDMKGNSLGERTSTNKIKVIAGSVAPGQVKTIVVTVVPTYLYILSDEDLDTPNLIIN